MAAKSDLYASAYELWRAASLDPALAAAVAVHSLRAQTAAPLIRSTPLIFGIPQNPAPGLSARGTGGDRVLAISCDCAQHCHTYGEIGAFVTKM
jgi:hypothetical protein